MSTPLIGYPNVSDDGTLSGGDWESTLPLTEAQKPVLSDIARSTDATEANTQFENDLGSAEVVKLVGVHNHNLSLDADVRIRGWTHESSRSGTANYRDEDGVLTSQPTLEARHWHYQAANDGTTYRTTLLEGAGQNEVTTSEDLTATGDWTASNLSARNADQATGPGGTLTLDELVEDGTNGAHGVFQTPTMTADATYAVSCWAMAETRNWLVFDVFQSSTPANNFRGWFNLSTGALGTTSAGGTGAVVRTYVEDWTNVAAGLYRCVMVGSIGNSATSIRARIGLADANGSLGYTGDGSSSLYAGHVMMEDDAEFASSVIATTTAAASRDADLLQETAFPTSPADIEAAGGMTVASEWVEMGTAFSASSRRYFQIGGPGAPDDPRLLLFGQLNADGRADAAFDDGTSFTQVGAPTGTVALFDRVRALTTIYLDGSTWKIKLDVYVNDDPVVSATPATIGSTLPAAWSANTLTIGAAPDDTLHGSAGHIRHVFAKGEKTLTEMEALEAGDNDVFYHWEAYDSQFESAFPTAYPSGTELWGEGVGGKALRQKDLDALERVDYVEVLPTKRKNRYWTVEFSDTSNSDGYVQFGRLWISPAWDLSGVKVAESGSLFGWHDDSETMLARGGASYSDVRSRRREWDLSFEDIPEDQAWVQTDELYRRLGLTEQFVFVLDADDATNLQRTSFLAKLREIDPIRRVALGANTVLAIREEV